MTMDYPRSFLFLMLATLAVCQAQNLTDPPQFGAMSCNVNGSVMSVAITVFTNGSDIVGAVFFNMSNTNTRYDTGDCQFRGNGSDSNPFRADIEIDLNTNTAPSGRTFCGHYLVPNTSPKQFLWAVHSFIQKGFERYGDKYIYYNCTEYELPTVISQTVRVQLDIDKNLTKNNGFINFEVTASDGSSTISEINIGEQMRLRIRYSPSDFDDTDASDPSLRPWGAYCRELYATPDLNSNRREHLQDKNGCPRSDEAFLRPSTNFAQVNVDDSYIALTGNIESARFDKSVDDPFSITTGRVYFVCLAEICWRQSDDRCRQRCQTTSSRRKRQALNETYTLITYVDVVDVKRGTEEKTSEFLPIEFVIGISVGGVLLLIALTAMILYLMMRGPRSRDNYVKHSSTSSVASTVSGRSYPDITKMSNRDYRY